MIAARGLLSEGRKPGESPGNRPWTRSDSGSYRPATSAQKVDLLNLLDPSKDAVAGEWRRNGYALVTPEIQRARIQVPCGPPEEYDIRTLVTRKRGNDAFVVGLIFDGKPCMVVIDGNRTGASWIEVKGGEKGISESGITYFEGNSLRPNRKAEIVYSVRKDRLIVTVDTFTILDWRGENTRLFIGRGWEVPSAEWLFIGSYETTFVIEEMALTVVSGTCTFLR
jgi:hypothetical protein